MYIVVALLVLFKSQKRVLGGSLGRRIRYRDIQNWAKILGNGVNGVPTR